MDSKKIEEVFQGLWQGYLNLEKEIWQLSESYDNDSSDTLKEAIYNLCGIAISQINSIEYMALLIMNGETLTNFQENCKTKRNDLYEISSKVIRSQKNNV